MAEPAAHHSHASLAHSARHGSSTMSGDVIQEIFLSPRVVDREAFNDFSASLRRLIEQASSQAEALKVASESAISAQNAIRELTGKNHPKIEAAARALAMLDSRAQEADRLVGAARDAAASLELLRRNTQTAVHQHQSELTGRLEAALKSAEERIAELERKAQGAGLAQLDAMESRLAALIAQSDAAAQRLAEQASANQARMTAAAQDVLREAADAHAKSDHLRAELSVMLSRAEAMLEGVPSSVGGERPSLGRALASVDEAQTKSDRVATALASSCEQAEIARARLSDAIDHGATHVDQLSDFADNLRESIARTIESSKTALQDANTKREELKVALQGPMVEMESLGDEIRARLQAASDQANQQQSLAQALTDQSTAVVERLGVLAEQLQPWKGLLIDATPDAPMPEPLAKLVAQVRADLAADLTRIAGALSEITGRTSRLASVVRHEG